MKLWLLLPAENLGITNETNPWIPWYDKAHGFVIRAETQARARKLADSQSGDENRLYGVYDDSVLRHPWLDSSLSTCVELLQEGDEEIILNDFQAA